MINTSSNIEFQNLSLNNCVDVLVHPKTISDNKTFKMSAEGAELGPG